MKISHVKVKYSECTWMHWVASSLATSLTSFEQACKETLVIAFVGELGFGVFLDEQNRSSLFSPNSKYEFKLMRASSSSWWMWWMIPNDPRNVDKSIQKHSQIMNWLNPPNLEGIIRLWRLTVDEIPMIWCPRNVPKMSWASQQCQWTPSWPADAHGSGNTLLVFFLLSPHVLEGGEIGANMTCEEHHFSVACQILLLWAPPGPALCFKNIFCGISEFESLQSFCVFFNLHSVIVGVLLQLLQCFGGRAVARVGGVLKQLNGDVFVISSRIRNEGQNWENSNQSLQIMSLEPSSQRIASSTKLDQSVLSRGYLHASSTCPIGTRPVRTHGILSWQRPVTLSKRFQLSHFAQLTNGQKYSISAQSIRKQQNNWSLKNLSLNLPESSWAPASGYPFSASTCHWVISSSP